MQAPFQPFIFMNQMPGFGGVNPVGIGPSFPAQNVMNGWQGIYNSNNMNNMNNMNQMNNMQQYDVDKINVVFKLTNGSIKIVTISLDKTVGELICIFLKKMGSEELIGNTKDICFLNNATKIKYDDQRKVRDVFNAINPTIIVNDVHNLIGAN
jgi:hypothetical protein